MDEHPEVWGDTILSVVKVGNGTFGVHVFTSVHFPVLEGAEDLLDGALSVLLEGIDLGLITVLFELLEDSLKQKIRKMSQKSTNLDFERKIDSEWR